MTRASRQPYVPEEDEILRRCYPHNTAAAVAEAIGRSLSSVQWRARRLGLTKSEAFKASDRSGRIQRGKQSEAMKRTQFKPGTVPVNKGVRRPGWAPGRMAETQFKKGRPAHEARNYVPIGTEKITKDGQLVRKVTDDPSIFPVRRWVSVARLVWEEAHGPIPPKHVIAFKPGCATTDPARITPDVLVMRSMREHLKRNSVQRFPPELRKVIQLKGALTRVINNRSKQA